MPWRALDIRKARIEFVILADRAGRNFTKLCASVGISRVTGYRWLSRYRRLDQPSNLVEISRRPHASPSKIGSDIENKVLEFRDHFGWGARTLSVLLRDQTIRLGTSTINRDERDCCGSGAGSRRRKGPALTSRRSHTSIGISMLPN